MNASQTGRNEPEAVGAHETRSPPAPEGAFARTIADVFAAAARRGAGGGNPFAAAVSAYLSRNPDTPPDAAARAVADIICGNIATGRGDKGMFIDEAFTQIPEAGGKA